jgi:hypothetical protein
MKSFKHFKFSEDMANPRDVSRQDTKDIAPLYKWLTQQSGKNIAKKDKHMAKTRDVVGAEIAKRAQEGEKDAKAVYRNLALDKLYHKGQSQFGEENTINEVDSKYIVAKSPKDNKWYAMGHVGSNKWMPVSDGFKSKAEAKKWAKIQTQVVNPAAEKELGGI